MADFSTPFGKNAGRRLPTSDERLNGFPCGPADQTLFNGLFHRIESEIGEVISHAGVAPSDANFTQLRQAIEALISAATGGGDTEQFLLVSQASARLPIYPEIISADNRINISSPASGTVRLPGNINWMHRGIVPMITEETDFNTVANKTYHLRWTLGAGYVLRDLSDNAYNPSSLGEDNVAFDSDYDDMLIARVVTNSSNVAAITNLANKHDLVRQAIVAGSDFKNSGNNWANALIQDTFNWSRRPSNFSFHVIDFDATNQDDLDINTFDPSGNRLTNVNENAKAIPVNRYRLNVAYMRDGMTALNVNWNARA